MVEATRRPFFLQDPPRLGNTFDEDSALRGILSRVIHPKVASPQGSQIAIYDAICSDLHAFGERCAPPGDTDNGANNAANASLQESSARQFGPQNNGDVYLASLNANERQNEPYLVQHAGGWGARSDQIRVSEGWKYLHAVSAQEGLIALGYETGRSVAGEYARLWQFAKLYMFAPVSALYTCPLAMTDGAAKCCEDVLAQKAALGLSERVCTEISERYKHLTTRDPMEFWTSGQWMTERTGGSDVGGCETLATAEDPSDPECEWYTLSGYKFFTSATTSELTFTFARIVDPKTGTAMPGSRGLTMFMIDTWRERQRSIIVHRLKDKLGTRQLPTAELELVGTRAMRIGPAGRGVPIMSSLFNVTRIHNAANNAASMRGLLAVARDYAHRRYVFGKPLSQQPLHLTTLADAEVLFRGCLQFAMHETLLFGRSEYSHQPDTSRDNVVLRIMTPLGKLFVAKAAVANVCELLESFGGAGYMEDTGLPRALRDVFVGTIWEGTTNVLSLDTLRALAKYPTAFEFFSEDVSDRVQMARSVASASPLLLRAADAVDHAMSRLTEFYQRELKTLPPAEMTVRARQLALSMARTYSASLLLQHASWEQATYIDAAVALRFCSNFGPLVTVGMEPTTHLPHAYDCDEEIALDKDVVTGNYRGWGSEDKQSHRARARL